MKTPQPAEHSCVRCLYGILRRPAATNYPAPLYIMRAMMYARGRLEFCTCAVGQAAARRAETTLRELGTGADYLSPSTQSAINTWLDENPLVPTESGV